MQNYLDSSWYHKHPMDITEVCHMFHVSRSGYYAWYRKQNDKEAQKKREEYEKEMCRKVRHIISILGYTPGKRTLSSCFRRFYNEQVSVKRCRRLLKEMNLQANRPKKDAYKHQATHDHEYAAPADNVLERQFFIGPRKVILTDITYLYYGPNREPFYVCCFRDAYTDETLGKKTSRNMDIDSLVKPAYEEMMRGHEAELRHAGVYLHSDQGSQYMSTTFEKLLTDDGFIHSVSGRGVSLDNSPQESFFGRMKARILDLVALAPDFETASRLVEGFLHQHDTAVPQYRLGGLTPVEFYQYAVTGIYSSTEGYYGVSQEDLRRVDQLIQDRRKEAEAKAAKVREQSARAKENSRFRPGKDPESVIRRDIRILEKEEKRWEEQQKAAEAERGVLAQLIERAERALEFVKRASEELREKLRTREEWHKHPELSYIFAMDGMF